MSAGRPTKLTPERQTKIVSAMRAGNYFGVSCEYAGISAATGHRWMTWGHPDFDREAWLLAHPTDKTKPPRSLGVYRSFREAVTRASAAAEVEAAAELRKGGREDWRASAEYLQRRHPDRWGRQRVDVRHEGEVAIGGPVGDVLAEFDDVFSKLAGAAVPVEPEQEEETGADHHDQQ